MRTTGELYEHKGLIAFTSAFLATLTLAGCGNEKQADPQDSQIEIAVQQEEPLTTGEHSVAPVIIPLTPPIPQPQQIPRQILDIDKVYQVYPTPLSQTKELVATLKPPIALAPKTTSVPYLVPSTVSGSGRYAYLGVVVNIHKNKAGQVEHYELFHGQGRKGKTPAFVTDWHKRTPTRISYPPFGNGQQQRVAMAGL